MQNINQAIKLLEEQGELFFKRNKFVVQIDKRLISFLEKDGTDIDKTVRSLVKQIDDNINQTRSSVAQGVKIG